MVDRPGEQWRFAGDLGLKRPILMQVKRRDGDGRRVDPDRKAPG